MLTHRGPMQEGAAKELLDTPYEKMSECAVVTTSPDDFLDEPVILADGDPAKLLPYECRLIEDDPSVQKMERAYKGSMGYGEAPIMG